VITTAMHRLRGKRGDLMEVIKYGYYKMIHILYKYAVKGTEKSPCKHLMLTKKLTEALSRVNQPPI
jgi:hypothetical protein